MFGARKLQRRSKTRTGANRAALVSGRARYSLLARGQGIRMNRQRSAVGRSTNNRSGRGCMQSRKEGQDATNKSGGVLDGTVSFLATGGAHCQECLRSSSSPLICSKGAALKSAQAPFTAKSWRTARGILRHAVAPSVFYRRQRGRIKGPLVIPVSDPRESAPGEDEENTKRELTEHSRCVDTATQLLT